VGGNPLSYTDPSGNIVQVLAPFAPQIGSWIVGTAVTLGAWWVGTNVTGSTSNGDGAGPVNPPPIPTSPNGSPGEGWGWKGSGPPESGKGNWVNPETGQKLHPDLNHPAPKGPHWGLTNPDGSKWDFFPDKGKWEKCPR
jgi:hypothetical protein